MRPIGPNLAQGQLWAAGLRYCLGQYPQPLVRKRTLIPRTSFSREKEAKSKRHAPFGKNLWIARVWETGGAITLGLRRYLLRPLQGDFISARPCFRFPNRAEVFPSVATVAAGERLAAVGHFGLRGGTWGQSLRPSSMATSLCTREALLRITSSCGEEHEDGMNVPTAGVPSLHRHESASRNALHGVWHPLPSKKTFARP